MLDVRMLGQFDLRANGTRLVIHSRGAQSLFAFLALTIGQILPREHIIGTLWADLPEMEGRRHLRQELWHIRQALTEQSLYADEFILADEFTLGLNHDASIRLDTLEFEHGASEKETIADVITRASLYRGELLPGFYQDWVAPERERFAGLYEATMCDLLRMLVEAERWHCVVEWAENWISISRTPEPAFCALMSAYNALHDTSKVLESYARCCAALAELGVDPSAETLALYDKLTKHAWNLKGTASNQEF